ncbi:MAG: DEAD/DEAH box helicase [Defluviitaleaceae bacterium]|nr:DEAD/DEAH box helicase [Defluviitaleaceae bacterium]
MNLQEIFNRFEKKPSMKGVTVPTEVQRQTLPLILERRDLFVQSPTGTGKTLAYLLPVFAGLNQEVKGAQAVIVAPTYELASQIAHVARGLAERAEDVALLIGGADKKRQATTLKAKPAIIVGSLGRITDFVVEKKLSMHHVRTLVFDEADRLFDEKNTLNIQALIRATLRERQILLFSATMPRKIIELATPLMKEPESLTIDNRIPKNIRHFYVISEGRKKAERLRSLIHNQKIEKALVFVNRPYDIEKTAERLNFHNMPSSPLHGGNDKMARKAAMEALRRGKIKALVASDAGSRGLDVAGLTHVVNLDLPMLDKDYVHRAGRCGRAGADGIVISVVTIGEAEALKKMAVKLKIPLEELK